MFSNILHNQLCIDEEQFWNAVDNGVKPKRATPAPSHERSGIDAKLARSLITKVGMDSKDLMGLNQEDAVKIWNEWLSSGGGVSGKGLA
jgi:hypothetical protein